MSHLIEIPRQYWKQGAYTKFACSREITCVPCDEIETWLLERGAFADIIYGTYGITMGETRGQWNGVVFGI